MGFRHPRTADCCVFQPPFSRFGLIRRSARAWPESAFGQAMLDGGDQFRWVAARVVVSGVRFHTSCAASEANWHFRRERIFAGAMSWAKTRRARRRKGTERKRPCDVL